MRESSPRSIPVANSSFDITTVQVTFFQHLEEPISVGSARYTLFGFDEYGAADSGTTESVQRRRVDRRSVLVGQVGRIVESDTTAGEVDSVVTSSERIGEPASTELTVIAQKRERQYF